MNRILRALRSDLFLYRHSRGIRWLFALIVIAPAAPIAWAYLGAASQLAERAIFAGEGASAGTIESPASAWPLFLDGTRAAWGLAFLSLLAISAHSLASDRETGSARVLLTSGVSRSQWVFARYASLLALGVLLAAAGLGAAWGLAALAGDFGAITEDGVEIFSEAEVGRESLRALLAAAATLPALVAFGLLISSLARSAAIAVAVALASTMVWDFAKSLLGPIGSWGYASFHPSPLDTSYLREVAQMARGFSDFRDLDPLNSIVPWPTALVCLAVAWGIASRRKL